MVNMNEDFGAYKDSIWKGLTARELGVMAVSAVSCGIIIILLYFILGWNLYISFLIGTAVAAAIIFSQVWKSRSGLSAIEQENTESPQPNLFGKVTNITRQEKII